MKRWNRHIRRGLMITAALVLVCATALAAISYPFNTVTTASVRLRRNPSSRATVLKNLSQGASVEVLGSSGNYFKVKYDKYTGYVLKEFINTDENVMVTATPEVEETVSSYPYTTVTRDTVNLRGAKSTRAKLVKRIPKGATVTVSGVNGSWAEVTYDQYSGYCKSEFLVLKKVVKITTPKPTPTPTPIPTLTPEEDAGGYTVLQQGDSGSAVKSLQRAMNELGFLTGGIDGNFGEATKLAVIQFQMKNEYPATGIMDANVQAFLYAGQVLNALGETVKIKTLSPAGGASMHLGNVGDEVGELQRRLTELKYYKGEINDTYDEETVKAVRAFQKKNGLKSDGVAGAETRRAISAATAVAADATQAPPPTPVVTPTAEPVYEIPTESVKLNSKGNAAKQVQKRLKELGYYRGQLDGIFGKGSVTALTNFQTAHGIDPNGIAGPATYAVLFSSAALPSGVTPSPAPATETPMVVTEPTAVPQPTAVPYTTLRKGDTGDDVALMQERLIVLYYLEEGSADGNYGTKTVQAVRNFQKQNSLTVDGTAGAETLTRLYDAAALPAAQATATPKPTATPAGATATPAPQTTSGVLKKGDKGAEVKSLQARLNELGYTVGKPDGVFGAKTFLAVISFQKMNRLTADGIAGKKTLEKLNSASAISAGGTAATATPKPSPTPIPTAPPISTTMSASKVIYANWYTTVKAIARKYPYCTVYDFSSGISWQIHIFSLGAHADYEPLTANDTAKMMRVFGSNTWNPKAVWVQFADGSIYLASTHNMPHETQHIKDNNFNGHSCLHFPRTQAQVEAIGQYATSHQTTIDAAWLKTQQMAGK